MALTREEIEALVERKLLERKGAIVDALLKFNRRPSAKTFKDAENIPDRLVGVALDEIVGEVLRETAPEMSLDAPCKKKLRNHGWKLPPVQLRHGRTVEVRVRYYRPAKAVRRGRRRGVGRRGAAGTGRIPPCAVLASWPAHPPRLSRM